MKEIFDEKSGVPFWKQKCGRYSRNTYVSNLFSRSSLSYVSFVTSMLLTLVKYCFAEEFETGALQCKEFQLLFYYTFSQKILFYGALQYFNMLYAQN